MKDYLKLVLSKDAQRVFKLLQKLPLDSFYLAGGTALALQLGHRISVDFDFFSPDVQLDLADRQGLKEAFLQDGTKLEISVDKDKTLIVLIDKVRVSFFYYPYKLLNPLRANAGIDLASLEDIAAMKFSAIIGRGTKRDFIDLYEIAQQITLEELLKKASKKYSQVSDFALQALKSLTYFEDAEVEAMPRLLKSLNWVKVRTFFQKEVDRISHQWLSETQE